MSAGSSSTNLSYLVNSLKKFVNTNTTSHLDLSQQGSSAGQQQQQPPYSGQYFDPANSFQAQSPTRPRCLCRIRSACLSRTSQALVSRKQLPNPSNFGKIQLKSNEFKSMILVRNRKFLT